MGRVRVNGVGEWVLVTETPLAPGPHKLSLKAITVTGQVVLSESVVALFVPAPPVAVAEAAPKAEPPSAVKAEVASVEQAAPAPESAPESDPEPAPAALAVLIPRKGVGTSRILVADEPVGLRDRQLVLKTIDYDEVGQVVVSGEAPPGDTVIAYLDDEPVGQAKADPEGRWEVTPSDPVAPGLYSLRVEQVDEAGGVQSRVETPFARAEAVPLGLGRGLVIVQPGNSLWRIARRTYGDGFHYTIIYQANSNRIRNPDLIYPGQIFRLPEEG